MKRSLLALSTALLLLSTSMVFADGEKKDGKTGWNAKNRLQFESADGDFTLRIGLLGQFLFTNVDDDSSDTSTSFRTRRVRPDFRGKLFGSVGYRVQYELAGSPSLLDFYLNWGSDAAKLQVGQFKAPFGRQELTGITKQQFVDRSIASRRFVPSRQQGIAVLGSSANSKVEYRVGIFNGNGRNTSRDDNDDKLIAGRVVFNPFGAYALDESSLDRPDSPKLSVGISGMSNTEGNGLDEVDISRLGGELAFKVQGLGILAEYYQETADPALGADIDTDGYYAQVGYLFPNKRFEVALRFAALSPDVIGPSRDQTETGAAFNFFINKHGQKVQLDYRQLEFDADPGRDSNELRLQVQISF